MESATAPAAPASSRGIALGALAAIIAALVVAEGVVAVRVLRGQLSPVDAAADIERATGIPTLDLRAGAASLAFYQAHLGSLPAITILASEDTDESLAVDLARLSAGIHDRVLLIDGDWRRPSLHRHLGLEAAPGLSDFADRQLSLGAAVRPGPLGGRVAVLTAGSVRGSSASSHRHAIERAVDESGADQSVIVASVRGDELRSIDDWLGSAAAVVLIVNVADGRRRPVIGRTTQARRDGVGIAAVLLVDATTGGGR